MAGVKGREQAAEERVKAAAEETAKWINEQIEHVWNALGLRNEEGRELKRRARGKESEYLFVYRGRVLAEARSYFGFEEQQWRFELTQVDRERYGMVKEYFAGRR